MGLVDIAAQRIRAQAIDEWLENSRLWFGGGPSKSGISVSEKSALKFVAVYACVRILSESLAWPPLKVYRARPSGGRDEARDHPLYDLLHAAPNDEMPALTLKETIQSHAVSSGNGYALPTFNRRGQIVELYPWPWTDIEPRRDPVTNALYYDVLDRGKSERLPKERVFHIPGLGFDGIRGYSPIRMAMEAIGLGLAAEEFAGRFYSNGANIGGILTVEGLSNKDTKERAKTEIAEKFEGLGRSHKVMVLEKGSDFKRLDMPLAEAQFLETRRFQIEEIARLYRVPPHMLADLERATFSNVEHLDLAFVKHTMMPWYVRWEQYINFRLLTREERRAGYYVEFNLGALLRGDSKTQAEISHMERQDGIISTDEWRERIGMNPVGGTVGQAHLVNGNMISVETAVKQQPRGAKKKGGDTSNAQSQ